jgi:hypothetical protein
LYTNLNKKKSGEKNALTLTFTFAFFKVSLVKSRVGAEAAGAASKFLPGAGVESK